MKGIIVYATKYGCTEKAVRLLRAKIPQQMEAVNVAKEKTPDMSSFDTVILGGPIYVGKMHGALGAYMRQHLEALKKKRLALFVCAGEQDPVLCEKQLAAAFPRELADRAVMREAFGGELYWDKLDVMTKLILRVVKGIKGGYARLSEAKIEKFARGVLDA